jgi:cysteine desulfurase
MRFPLYFDYHATTPVDPAALEAMLPYFTERFGNAASRNHAYGWAAAQAVETARAQVGTLIGAHHRDVVFTSGATESNNLAIKGVARSCRDRGRHIVTVATEHRSVLDTCRCLEGDGFEVTCLPVGPDGLVDVGRVEEALRPGTILVTVMAANNEIGVLQPLAEIGRLTRERGIPLHTDASQAVAKVPFDVDVLNVDLASLTGHKMYGPKGVGALFVRRKNPCIELSAMMHGGGHERGLRSGTLNVPAIVGFGKAAEIGRSVMPDEQARVGALRDRLLEALARRVPDLHVNGSRAARLPNNLNVSFRGVESEMLAMSLDDVAVSSGSACHTASAEPSHVLTALGLDDDLARASLRFGLGRWTTEEEVEYVAEKIGALVPRLRQMKAELDGKLEV